MAEGTAIVAKIVIDGSGISGLGSVGKAVQDPENTVKRTNKLFRELLALQRLLVAENAGGLLKKIFGGAIGAKFLKAIGGSSAITAAGGLTAAALAGNKASDMTAETLNKIIPGFSDDVEELGMVAALAKAGWEWVNGNLIKLGDTTEEAEEDLRGGSALLVESYESVGTNMDVKNKDITLSLSNVDDALKRWQARIDAQNTRGSSGGGGIQLSNIFDISKPNSGMEWVSSPLEISEPPEGFGWAKSSGAEVE